MSAPAAAKGTLYLVPTPLDHGCDTQSPLEDVLPLGTIKAAAALTHWISENAKSTRAFLKRVDALVPLAQPIQAQQITELPREGKGWRYAPKGHAPQVVAVGCLYAMAW